MQLRTLLFLAFTWLAAAAAQGQTVTCNTAGNLIVYANYEGGVLNINVDVNIPNLRVGVVGYNAAQVNFSGPFVGNIIAVEYAGVNDDGTADCAGGVATTAFNGLPGGVVPVINVLPNGVISSTHGNSLIVCAYDCDTTTWQGGCNTLDETAAYFTQTLGGTLRYQYTMYDCWIGTYNVSDGGNCCIGATICNVEVDAGSDAVICSADSVQLGATTVGVTSFSWSPSNTLLNANTLTPLAFPTQTTTYVLIGTDATCSDTDSVTITVNPLPGIIMPVLDPVCEDAPAFTLPDGQPTNGQWSGNGVVFGENYDPQLVNPGNDTLTYSFTDGNGCQNSATAILTIHPTPPTPVVTQTAYDTVMADIAGADVYHWFWLGMPLPNDTTQVIFAPAEGYYSVVVEVNGCLSALSDSVYVLHGATVEGLSAIGATFGPNPTGGTAQFASPVPGLLVLHNVLGQTVFTQPMQPGTHTLHLHTLPAGTYVGRFTATGTGQSGAFRVVVAR